MLTKQNSRNTAISSHISRRRCKQSCDIGKYFYFCFLTMSSLSWGPSDIVFIWQFEAGSMKLLVMKIVRWVCIRLAVCIQWGDCAASMIACWQLLTCGCDELMLLMDMESSLKLSDTWVWCWALYMSLSSSLECNRVVWLDARLPSRWWHWTRLIILLNLFLVCFYLIFCFSYVVD